MAWYPAGLDRLLVSFADAIDKRFQPINPSGPVKVASYTRTELLAMVPEAPAIALNATSGKLAVAVLNATGTAYVWHHTDGTSL